MEHSLRHVVQIDIEDTGRSPRERICPAAKVTKAEAPVMLQW